MARNKGELAAYNKMVKLSLVSFRLIHHSAERIITDPINSNAHQVYVQESKDKKKLATILWIVNYHHLVIFGSSDKYLPLIFINSAGDVSKPLIVVL